MGNSIFIRTDMNNEIATGHVMRCLSIAEAAAKRGTETVFLLADGEAVELVESRGFRAIVLGTDWKDMDSETDILIRTVEELRIRTVLVDSYQVTEKYLSALRQHARSVYMDDINAFHYPVDALIAYGICSGEMGYEREYPDIPLYLGCDYVPLRGEFAGLPQKRIPDHAGRLLILSGGTDPYKIIENMLRLPELRKFGHIDAVCGRYSDGYERLREEWKHDERVHLYQSHDRLADLMLDADIAVSAGGTTLFELCAAGTPTVAYTIADNQLAGTERFAGDGIMGYAGDARWDDVFLNTNRLLMGYADADIRKEKSMRMQKLVDGKGAERIVEILAEQAHARHGRRCCV